MKPAKRSLRRHLPPIALLLHVLLASGQVGAAGNSSVQIKVTGSVVPPACTIALTAGDTIDYGRMQFSELEKERNTILSERNLSFTINCDAPAKLALTLQDEQPATVVQDLIKGVRGEADANQMANGLGAVNGVNIGIFYVRVFAGDGSNNPGALRTLRSQGLEGWSETPVDAPLYADGSKPVGFSTGQTSVPTAFTTLTGRLAVQPVIRPSAELPSTHEIFLAGSSTLTVYYQ